MKRLVLCTILTLTTLCLTATLPPAHAEGPGYNAMFQAFCQGQPGEKWRGCARYWSYRITEGGRRQGQLASCEWWCNYRYTERSNNPVAAEQCIAGCKHAANNDN